MPPLLLCPQGQPEVHILITVLLQFSPATPEELNSLCHSQKQGSAVSAVQTGTKIRDTIKRP